jgi:hypothetical protein
MQIASIAGRVLLIGSGRLVRRASAAGTSAPRAGSPRFVRSGVLSFPREAIDKETPIQALGQIEGNGRTHTAAISSLTGFFTNLTDVTRESAHEVKPFAPSHTSPQCRRSPIFGCPTSTGPGYVRRRGQNNRGRAEKRSESWAACLSTVSLML